ncbi:hypothetical protein [Maridesulfovibrio bastinii]|uniref:hypothetical protein n=1 Tax=Maridesulfovibrio bastinii TaxID=47157 RepID=UPI0004070B5E|nr:hypothetical protein [Maridesulfovibrio bastinii]
MPLLTEEKAKEMWCPQARQTDEGSGAYNRDGNGAGDKDCRCIASDCMSWRWKDRETEIMVYRYKEDHPDMMRHYTGYCGLAGKPEE